MNGTPWLSRAGFSLMELVTAMAIFSMSVLACLELYSVSLQSAGDSVSYTQAVFLAQGVMEETLAEDSLFEGHDSGEFSASYPDHHWEREITEVNATGLMKVEVAVHWSVRSREKTFSLVTLHGDRNVSEALP